MLVNFRSGGAPSVPVVTMAAMNRPELGPARHFGEGSGKQEPQGRDTRLEAAAIKKLAKSGIDPLEGAGKSKLSSRPSSRPQNARMRRW